MKNILMLPLAILFNCVLLYAYPAGASLEGGGPVPENQGKSTLMGIVTDENHSPLPHVNLGIIGTNTGTTTDENGKFVFENVKPGLILLGATAMGYEDLRKEIELPPGETKAIDVMMPMRIYHMEPVSIIAGRRGIFEKVPGSLSYIDKEQILSMDPVSGNEVFRRSPGVHVVDEEGVGLRINIGIRGLDPDRSRSVLIMEDGIPVSLAPYGEPEMYYTPAMDRMAGLEILKGSGSILYGPQTIGGVVNYITADPPLKPKGTMTVRGAQGGFFTGMLSYGSTYGNTGYKVDFLRKQADSVGILDYRVNDLSARVRTQLSGQSSLGLRFGVYDESSNATYVGITQSMYEAGGDYDFTRIAPYDVLNIRRYSLSLTHNHFINNISRITTKAYGYTTTRNWQRQDFSYNSFDSNGNINPKPLNYSGIKWGDESIPNGAIYMRNSTGNRNRQFEVAGLESSLSTTMFTGNYKNDLTAGGRFLFERAYEQRVNGQQSNASSGELLADEIRTGYGSSAFVHNQLTLSPRISITAGLRAELFHYERDIRRSRFQINGQTQLRDTLLVAGSSLFEVIPGMGFNINLWDNATFFGGIHRGFAPPRVKDAVSNSGQLYHLDAEKSWNYEAGVRQRTETGVGFELTAFYMDFANQVIPVAESAGGMGAGLINGGETHHRGFEASLEMVLSQWWDSHNYTIIWDGSATYVDSRFVTDRFINSSGNTINIKGNKTPYAPSWFANSSIAFSHNTGLSVRFSTNYTGSQFTDVLNSIDPSANGRIGKLEQYMVFDANIAYEFPRWGTITLSGKNITNERYIATRRPQGIRLGLPRMITAGFRVDF